MSECCAFASGVDIVGVGVALLGDLLSGALLVVLVVLLKVKDCCALGRVGGSGGAKVCLLVSS